MSFGKIMFLSLIIIGWVGISINIIYAILNMDKILLSDLISSIAVQVSMVFICILQYKMEE